MREGTARQPPVGNGVARTGVYMSEVSSKPWCGRA
jgi:hypothetical protein